MIRLQEYVVTEEEEGCLLSHVSGSPLPPALVRRLGWAGWTPVGESKMVKDSILNLRLRFELESFLREETAVEDRSFRLQASLSVDASGEHWLEFVPLAPEDLEWALNAAQSQGLPIRRWKDRLRGKFSYELFSLSATFFGEAMSISTEVRDYAAYSVHTGDFPPILDDVANGAGIQLFPYQATSIAFLIKRSRAILAAGPGTGKTNIALLAARYLELPVLVICPLTLIPQWQQAAQQLGVTLLAANPEKLPSLLRDSRWTATDAILILDESSLYRNRKALRSRLTRKLATGKKVVWELSGSPVVKSIDQLWSQLNLLDPTRWPSYWNFARRYCSVITTKWGTSIAGNLPGSETVVRKNLSDVMLSYLSEDVIALPDWRIQVVPCRMGGEQDAIYRRAVRELLVELSVLGEEETPSSADYIRGRMLRSIASGQTPGRIREDGSAVLFLNSPLSSLTRSLQIASSPKLVGAKGDSTKWNKCEVLVRDHLNSEQQGLIWFLYRRTGELLEQRLGRITSVGRIDGSTTPQRRKELLSKFQQGAIKVLLLHPGVAKFGLNLQNAAYAIYAERNFDQEAFYQSMYRTKRLGSLMETQIYFLVAETATGKKTVDHLVHRALSFQTNMMRDLLTGEIAGILGENL